MISDYIDLTYRNMKKRKRRSYLVMVGIIIGIASIVALISLGSGLENAIKDQFSKLGADSIRVMPGSLRGPPVGVTGLTTKDSDALENVHGVKYITPMLFLIEKVGYGGEEKYVSIIAYPSENVEARFSDFEVTFSEGRTFTERDKFAVVVGSRVAKDAFDKDIRARTNLKIRNTSFEVVGLFAETGSSEFDNYIFMPVDTARVVFGKPDEVNVILVRLEAGASMQDARDEIVRTLKRERGNENFSVFTPEQILQQLSSILGVIKIVLAGIAAISLIVGGIGIMNAMYTSVLERTREIGVIKSVGAKNSDILAMFLLESGFVGLFGGILGAFLGLAVSYGIEAAAKYAGYALLRITFDARLVLFSIAFAFIVGIASGFLPAKRAAALAPAEALRYE